MKRRLSVERFFYAALTRRRGADHLDSLISGAHSRCKKRHLVVGEAARQVAYCIARCLFVRYGSLANHLVAAAASSASLCSVAFFSSSLAAE